MNHFSLSNYWWSIINSTQNYLIHKQVSSFYFVSDQFRLHLISKTHLLTFGRFLFLRLWRWQRIHFHCQFYLGAKTIHYGWCKSNTGKYNYTDSCNTDLFQVHSRCHLLNFQLAHIEWSCLSAVQLTSYIIIQTLVGWHYRLEYYEAYFGIVIFICMKWFPLPYPLSLGTPLLVSLIRWWDCTPAGICSKHRVNIRRVIRVWLLWA